jgi:7,8-dihydropterin-6-yl-methyl-4-(beta-D-ribofuranosyl)aminobenzene 5'-phosphate synthase
MTHSTAKVEVVEGPRSIAPGVASLGPIPRQLFFFGWTPEQSLAVNVEGKGIVLITGCGHSTIQRIVERAEMLFDEPIYGIVGGLHYPVTTPRGGGFRLPIQRLIGTGKWPWDPINREDVEAGIACLQHRHPQLVALSPHDSCAWSIQTFVLLAVPAQVVVQAGGLVRQVGALPGFVSLAGEQSHPPTLYASCA